MARQKEYQNDNSLTGLDRLTGVNAESGATVNYTLDAIAEFLAQTGNSDGTRAGFLYNYTGEYTDTSSLLVPDGMRIEYLAGTPSTNFSFNTVKSLYFSNNSKDDSNFVPVRSYVQGGIIKLTNVTSVGNRDYAIYRVQSTVAIDNTGTPSNTGEYSQLNLAFLAGDGDIGLDQLIISPFGAGSHSGSDPDSSDGFYANPGPPPVTLGEPGDVYFDTTNGDYYVKVSVSSWGDPQSLKGAMGDPGGVFSKATANTTTLDPGEDADVALVFTTDTLNFGFAIPQGAQGDQGPAGATGPQGPAGADGTDGTDAQNPNWTYETIKVPYSETAVPFWRVKEGSAPYPNQTIEVGLVDGADGMDGTNGAVWHKGTILPPNTLGNDGDFYVYASPQNDRIYGPKVNGSWPSDYISIGGLALEISGSSGGQAITVDNIVFNNAIVSGVSGSATVTIDTATSSSLGLVKTGDASVLINQSGELRVGSIGANQLTSGTLPVARLASGPGTGQVLSWNGTTYAWVNQSGGGGSDISFGDYEDNVPTNLPVKFIQEDPNVDEYVAYVDASTLDPGNALQFNDTPNNGDTLGVNFEVSDGIVTATVDASDVSGGDTVVPNVPGIGTALTSLQINGTQYTIETGDEVTANPGGTGTILSTVQIDGVTYTIPGGGADGATVRVNGDIVEEPDFVTDNSEGGTSFSNNGGNGISVNVHSRTNEDNNAQENYVLSATGDGGVRWQAPSELDVPHATASVYGTVKLGSDAVQSVDAEEVTFTENRTYRVQVNADGQLVVNIPWTSQTPDVPVLELTQTGFNDALDPDTAQDIEYTLTVTNFGSVTLNKAVFSSNMSAFDDVEDDNPVNGVFQKTISTDFSTAGADGTVTITATLTYMANGETKTLTATLMLTLNYQIPVPTLVNFLHTPTTFRFTPANGNIEAFDTGIFEVYSSYADAGGNPNGWTIGPLTKVPNPNNDRLTVPANTDEFSLAVTATITQDGEDPRLNYKLNSDPTYNRTRSVRTGSIARNSDDSFTIPTDTTFADLSVYGDAVEQFGATDPAVGNYYFLSKPAEKPYIAYDASHPDLVQNMSYYGDNDLQQMTNWTKHEIAGFKVYISNGLGDNDQKTDKYKYRLTFQS